MTLRPHRLPDDVLARLASGGGGPEAVRHLMAAERSKHRLFLLHLMRLAEDDHTVGSAYDLLARIEKKTPEAVDRVLNYPAVASWTLRVIRSGGTGAARLGAVAAAAAVRAGIPATVEVPAPQGRIMLPSLGEMTVGDSGGPVDVRVHADGTVAAGGRRVDPFDERATGWRPIRRITLDGLRLCVDDLDPFRWAQDDVVDRRLSAAERDVWRRHTETAWRMLRTHHWTLAGETASIVSMLTPISSPARGMRSASAADMFGAVAMSEPPDGRWLASTFAHEVQHNKLNAVLDIVELIEPGEGVYYAPWRPDARPLGGLLHGTYAYLGVSGFWRRQRAHETDLRPHIEFAHWRRAAFEATATLLDSGRLTPTGRRFVTAMRNTLTAWQNESVPQAALAAAEEEEAAHRRTWLATNTSR